ASPCRAMLRSSRRPTYTFFPYTTLFRSLAVEEFFEPPLRVVVVGPGDRTARLRAAALALREPDRRVWTLENGGRIGPLSFPATRSEEHTSELQSRENLVCRLLLEKKKLC